MLRTCLKKARTAAQGDDQAAAESAIREAAKQLDKAAAHNLIHKNKASRLKSRLAKLMKKHFQQAS